jgi:V/A-type H+-transporting ATPase subunit I
MIVKMKEILLFTTTQSVDATIQTLGELGVMDIKEIEKPSSLVLERCSDDISNTEKAISILQNYKDTKKDKLENTTKKSIKDPKRIVERVLRTSEIKQKLQNSLNELNKQRAWYKTWGENVKVTDFDYLQKKNIHIRLYRIDKSLLKLVPKDKYVVTFSEKDGKIPLALFTQNTSEKLTFKEEPLPEISLNLVKEYIKRKERQLNAIELYLSDKADSIEALEYDLDILNDRLAAQTTLEGMGDIKGKVKYLKGYIPENVVKTFKTFAEENNWGYKISKPENPDDVPVYIKNPKWISIINPMMKFIDIVPGYKEVDVSIYFLVAFALFFAMLVGDAGYGFIFLILTILFRKKMSSQLRTLIYVLSGSTIIWGILSGTYFGAEQIAKLPILNSLVIDNIASFGVDNISFMMYLSFLIGAIHLTVAHSIRAIQFINSIKALSEVGWVLLVWGLFFVTQQLVLGNTAPSWNIWLFIVGATLVIFFSKESNSFLKSMGASIANLPLSLISGFSDIVSYVRLFAVGMATAAVASSFNNMALPDGISGLGIIDLLMAAVALLLGHGLNIALALMAVMVHGIRLNMLEFAGHLGVQFSGEAYNPFKLTTASDKLIKKSK